MLASLPLPMHRLLPAVVALVVALGGCDDGAVPAAGGGVCVLDPDCPDEGFCIGEQCVPDPPEGSGRCTAHQDCARGEVCRQAVCRPDDIDQDRVPDPDDNCPGVHNPSQGDRDGDGAGDLCDDRPDTFDYRLKAGRIAPAGGLLTGGEVSASTTSGAGSGTRMQNSRFRLRSGQMSPQAAPDAEGDE